MQEDYRDNGASFKNPSKYSDYIKHKSNRKEIHDVHHGAAVKEYDKLKIAYRKSKGNYINLSDIELDIKSKYYERTCNGKTLKGSNNKCDGMGRYRFCIDGDRIKIENDYNGRTECN